MINKNYEIKNRNIILTGATGKLGINYVDSFVECGAKIICIDINKNKLNTLKVKYKDKVEIFNADVTNKDKLLEVSNELINKKIQINALINNAAGQQTTVFDGEVTNFENYPLSAWEEEINIDLTGSFLCCQIFSKNFDDKNMSSIINISSTYGLVAADQRIYGDSGLNSSAAYATTKSGIIGLTKYLASYWQGKNIKVNAIAPAGVFNNQDPEFVKRYVSKTMLKRMATPEDLFGCIRFLISDYSNFMTGSTITIDGGWTAW